MMKKLDDIVQRVFKVKLDSFEPGKELKSLDNWDSLNHMLFITELEREFAMRLTSEDIIAMTNFEVVSQLIREKARA